MQRSFDLARGQSQEFFELAIWDWAAWRTQVDTFGRREALAAEVAALEAGAFAITRDLATRLLSRCTGIGALEAPLGDVSRLGAFLELHQAVFPLGAVFGPDSGPGLAGVTSGDALVRRSTRVELDVAPDSHPRRLARFHANRVRVGARVVFANGPARREVPLRMRAILGQSTVIATDLVTAGEWSTAVNPGDGSSSLTLRADFESTDPILGALGASHVVTSPYRDRVELLGRRLGDAGFTDRVPRLAPGETIAMVVQLAGDDVAGVPLQYLLSGPGRLGATAGVTDANGDGALVTYTAPSDATATEAEITVIADGVGVDVLSLDLAAATTTTTSTSSTTTTTTPPGPAFRVSCNNIVNTASASALVPFGEIDRCADSQSTRFVASFAHGAICQASSMLGDTSATASASARVTFELPGAVALDPTTFGPGWFGSAGITVSMSGTASVNKTPPSLQPFSEVYARSSVLCAIVVARPVRVVASASGSAGGGRVDAGFRQTPGAFLASLAKGEGIDLDTFPFDGELAAGDYAVSADSILSINFHTSPRAEASIQFSLRVEEWP